MRPLAIPLDGRTEESGRNLRIVVPRSYRATLTHCASTLFDTPVRPS
ncbi:hypothetical protein HMPREF3223_00617 [Cutibacterium avidum]|uniref:Uncharacterized protein n=1 Tax=Cutibacterium avidum ATCC 25577 TaxID=997355 RepID=G4CXQ8_9ACTN|nr:hypothetical protein HMPREF9153_1315 [Cutibacterium avidum ATCC 25577]KXA68288.1 hypothetical protein HMPREF3223_00617 [Cutibacterium avidum]